MADELPKPIELQRVRLDPEDIIVIRLRKPQPPEVLNAIYDQVNETFGDHKIAVINDLDLEILHPEPGRQYHHCNACGHTATWVASSRDEHNKPVDSCAYCGAILL